MESSGGSSTLIIDQVKSLHACLLRLEDAPAVPRFDIEWLRLRCEDTIRYSGETQRQSLQQLQIDVSQFVNEFPGLIPV